MSRSARRRKATELAIRKRPVSKDAAGAPASLAIGDPPAKQSTMHVLAYTPTGFVEQHDPAVASLTKTIAENSVTWINVEGLANAPLIEQLGSLFQLHRLALEDVVNVHQRAKTEAYGNVLFIVARMVMCEQRAATEQLSIFVGNKFVLTFQEGHPGDSFGRVRDRIRDGAGRIRQAGPDYLTYSLLDAAIDAYYPILETYAERLDELEDAVLVSSGRAVMDGLHEVKSDLLILRRAIWPQRESLAQLCREETPFFTDATRVYLRDCHDHIIQIVDLVETYRELTADLRDLFMSSISNRINETMRVLTIMSTIFIPLTFIAGIYGMNFDHHDGQYPLNMPELHWYFGYPLCLLSMLVTAVGMVVFFYRQGWIFRK